MGFRHRILCRSPYPLFFVWALFGMIHHSASIVNRSSHPLEIFKMAHVQGGNCFCLRYLLSDESWPIALTQKTMVAKPENSGFYCTSGFEKTCVLKNFWYRDAANGFIWNLVVAMIHVFVIGLSSRYDDTKHTCFCS